MAGSHSPTGGGRSDRSSVEAVTFVFGQYAVDTRTKRLLREGTVIPLTTKAFDTLEVLLRAAGHTVSKDELLQVVWPGTFVQEDTLAQNISTIRRALGETADSPRHVLTVPRDGYRFVAPVEVVRRETGPSESDPEPRKPAKKVVPTPHQRRSRRPLVQFALGTVSGAIVAAVAIIWLRSPGAQSTRGIPLTFEVFEPTGARFSSSGGALALSPDGRHLAFVAQNTDQQDYLWIKASGSRESTPLAGTKDASQPFWSADGHSIAFFSRGALRSVDVSGGEARTICQLASNANALSGSWSARNLILFAIQGMGLYIVRAEGGDATRFELAGMHDCRACLWPTFLPDGQHFLFTMASAEPSRGIYIGSLDGATPRRVLDVVSSTAYTDGYVIFASAGALVARRFDPVRGTVRSNILPIADHVWVNPITARAVFSASNTGHLAYREPLTTRLQWMSRSGRVVSTGPEGVFHTFTVSSAARVLASQLNHQLGTYDLWLYDADWRTATRLTFDPGSDLRPLWSSDGTKVVFARDLGRDGWQLFELNGDRAGAERPLLARPTPDIIEPILWKDDVLYYAALRSGRGSHIWTIRTGDASRASPVPVRDPSAGIVRGRLSPDGLWFAYTVNVSDSRVPRTALFVRPWSNGPGQSQIAIEGSNPRWKGDSSELFFIAPGGRLMAAHMEHGVSSGSPAALCSTEALAASGLAGDAYDAAPDGQRFVVKVPAHRPSIVVMSGWSARQAR